LLNFGFVILTFKLKIFKYLKFEFCYSVVDVMGKPLHKGKPPEIEAKMLKLCVDKIIN